MKVLLLGSDGQLGWELQRTCPDDIVLSAFSHHELDICNIISIKDCINKMSPDYIINATGYTAVDEAEKEKNAAFKTNHLAVLNLAQQAAANRIHLVHISTDYVFNGHNFKPYTIDDKPDPESIYGKSKLEGEMAAAKILGNNALIIRTGWLYSAHGHNFVKTILNITHKKENLRVIDDQIGTPTWAHGLAKAIWTAIGKNLSGTFHWTDAGVASWYDFAIAIQEEGIAAGLLKKTIPVFPVSSSEFPTPANRPFYSVLDKRSTWQAIGITPVHWRIQLKSMLKDLKNQREKA